MTPLLPVLFLAAAPEVMVVPTGGPPALCAARARLAAAARLAPGLRVVREGRAEGEALEDLKARLGADLALDAELDDRGLTLTWRAGAPRRAQGAGLAALAPTLLAVWPASLERPDAAGVAGGPNDESLIAACAGDAERAYAAAGAAVSVALTELAPPPEDLRRGTLLERWAWARVQRGSREGCRRAQATLRSVVSSLERGYLPPIWRRLPGPALPSAITRLPEAWVLFADGRFFGIDPDSGAALWQRGAPDADPHPVDLGAGRAALVHGGGLTVIETITGTAAWHAALDRPQAELAVSRGLVVAATTEELVALDLRTGAVRWRYDGLSTPIAGPVEVRGVIVAPLYSKLAVLDPRTGALLRTIDLGDEITAPLQVADDGTLWVAVGADEILDVDAKAGRIQSRTRDLFGAAWPPAVIAGRLVASTRPERGVGILAILDPDQGAPTRVRVRGLEPPVLGLGDFSGVVHALSRPNAIVARDFAGRERWRARQPGTVQALSAPQDLVVAGVGKRVVVLDRIRGRPLWTSELEAQVLDVRYGREGGVVALDNGALYGLPGGRDPRLPHLLRTARLDLAACQLELRSRAAAQSTAERVLARDPDAIDARRLVAEALEARGRPEAAAAWLDVYARTRPADPARAAAEPALAALAGITAQVPAPEGARELAGYSARAILIETPRGLEAVHPETGAPAEAKRPAPTVRLEDRVVIGPDWKTEIDDPSLVRLTASPAHVVLTGTTSEGRAQVLDARTGQTRWIRPLEAQLGRAWPTPEAILFETGDRLVGVDASTGAQTFRMRAPDPGAEIHPHAAGWLIREGDRLRGYDSQGRRRFDARPAKGLRGLVVDRAKSLAFYWTADALAALDLERGRKKGRLTNLAVRDVFVGEAAAVALTEDDRLVRFDPARALLPAK